MTARPASALACLAFLVPVLAAGQSTDTAAERARLGNQRIQAEAEQRAREEQDAQRSQVSISTRQPTEPQLSPSQPAALAGSTSVPTQAPAGPSGSNPVLAPPISGEAADTALSRQVSADEDDRTSRALRQIRELGELKDAGYVTEEEFRRIKDRILERQF